MADYAISNVPRRVVYAASGVGPYAFTFEILNQTDIAVYKASTLLTLTTDYSVTINANGTGSVTLVTSAGTSNITIVGAKNIQRTTDFTTGGDLFANTLNDELDNQTIYIQQVAETAERALKAPVTDPTDIAMTLPDKASRAGNVLSFDSITGNPIANITADDVANAQTYANNAAVSAGLAIASENAAASSSSSAAASALSASGSATSASASAAAASAVALGNEPVRHSVRPSLLLDFANTKTLDPRITFTRASTGTFYDGNATVKAEENLFLQSQDFATTWTTSNLTVTANTTTAPDGTTTADSIIPTTAASTSHRVIQSVTLTATPSVFSIYVKANGYTKVGIREVSVAGYYASFNLTAVTVLDSSLCTGSIVDAGNGWYRVTLSFTGVAGVNIWSIYPLDAAYTTGSPAAYTFTADGTSGLFVWGAQLEQRSSVTAYTATTTAPITNYIPKLFTQQANIARFDHNPVTGESLGLLIEEQRTNLILRSEEFENASWLVARVSSSANATISPSGTLTADKVIETATSGTHELYQGITATAASYTGTIYFKAGERTKIQLYLAGGGTVYYGIFDLVAGTVGSVTGSTTATITAVGNGWYRCSVTATLTVATWYLGISIVTGTTTTSYAGDGFSGVYIWGAQLEAGAFATSYIPTVASQVTRSADSASMTGTNFSSWYRADEGTLYAESLAGTWGRPVAFISEGVGNNYIRIQSSDTNAFVFNVMTNAATVVQMNTGVALAGKSALAFKANDFAGSANANTVTTDTAGALPIVSQLNIGSSITGSTNYLNGTIKKLAHYPKRLTNAELQGVTTV